MDPTKIAILGPGQMGLVSALVLGQTAPDAVVWLWGHDEAELDPLRRERRSGRLAGAVLGSAVEVTGALDAALEGAPVVINAIPVQHMRGVWTRAAPAAAEGCVVASVSKGLEVGTLERPTRIVEQETGGRCATCVLSGPTIAGELARGMPATMVAASVDEGGAALVQRLFTTPYLRVYTGRDVAGVELAGALKNVIAIAAGIIDGLGMGFNAKSALLARGLAEIVRLGVAMGAQRETFFGVAGVGDLATTCFCPEGRNRSCGESIGRGMTLDEHLAKTDSVVEGAATVKAAVRLAEERGVEMPISRAVHAVLYEGLAPMRAIEMLMQREAGAERVG